MTAFVVRILPDAEAELKEAFNWYRQRSHLAANGFRNAVFAAVDSLERTASMRPKTEDGFSYIVLERYPYTVYFDVTNNEAIVVAIAHHRRRPSYWRSRSS